MLVVTYCTGIRTGPTNRSRLRAVERPTDPASAPSSKYTNRYIIATLSYGVHPAVQNPWNEVIFANKRVRIISSNCAVRRPLFVVIITRRASNYVEQRLMTPNVRQTCSKFDVADWQDLCRLRDWI